MDYTTRIAKRILDNVGSYNGIDNVHTLMQVYDDKYLDELDDIIANVRKTSRLTCHTSFFDVGKWDIYIQSRTENMCRENIRQQIFDFSMHALPFCLKSSKSVLIDWYHNTLSEMNHKFMNNDRYTALLKEISIFECELSKEEFLKDIQCDITVWVDGNKHIIPIQDVLDKQSEFWKRGGLQKYEQSSRLSDNNRLEQCESKEQLEVTDMEVYEELTL